MSTFFDIIPLELKALINSYIRNISDGTNFVKALVYEREQKNYWELVYFNILGEYGNLIIENKSKDSDLFSQYLNILKFIESNYIYLSAIDIGTQYLSTIDIGTQIDSIVMLVYFKKDAINISDTNGKTILMKICEGFSKNQNVNLSSENYYLKLVKYILSKNPDINVQDRSENTALHHAIDNNFGMIAKLLIDFGANINITNNFGENALILASIRGNINLIEKLIERGADINFSVEGKNTALIGALDLGHNDTAKYLVNNGANVNISGVNDRSPLINAINNLDMTKLLVSKGANVNHRDNNGKTALDYAKQLKFLDVAEYLSSIN